jgi:hypothetical protein
LALFFRFPLAFLPQLRRPGADRGAEEEPVRAPTGFSQDLAARGVEVGTASLTGTGRDASDLLFRRGELLLGTGLASFRAPRSGALKCGSRCE